MNPVNPVNVLNNLNAVNDVSFQSIYTKPKLNVPEATSKNAFEGFFDAAVKLLDDTNRLQIIDERMTVAYAAGLIDDELAVMMAQQKAYSSLNFTVQVTNRVIEAYREIMRIAI